MLNQYPCLSELLDGLCKDGKKGRTWRVYMMLLGHRAGNNLCCSILNGLKGLGKRNKMGFGS